MQLNIIPNRYNPVAKDKHCGKALRGIILESPLRML